MTKEEFLELLERYMKGECSAKEQQTFDHFFETFQKQDAWATWDFQEKDRMKIELYRSLNRIIDAEAKTTVPAKRSFSMIRIAASVSILVSLGCIAYALFFYNPKVIYRTERTLRGQRSTITLADGSVIKLNAGSTLSFPEKFSGDTREVVLTGEAFFEIKRDPAKPFIIKTGELSTVVLGTSFNIRAYREEGKVEVTVKTGLVKVEDPLHTGSAALTLKPDEQASYDLARTTLVKREVSSDRYLAWASNIIYLDNTRMRDVISILENWYDVKITLQNKALGDCLLNGKYKGDRLVNILEGIKFMHGIGYRFVSEREIIINGKTCDPPMDKK